MIYTVTHSKLRQETKTDRLIFIFHLLCADGLVKYLQKISKLLSSNNKIKLIEDSLLISENRENNTSKLK